MWYAIIKQGTPVVRDMQFFMGYTNQFKPKFACFEQGSLNPVLYSDIDSAIEESATINKMHPGIGVIVTPLAAVF